MRRYTTEELVNELKEKWGEKYDYSKTIYKGSREKFSVICPTHGEFLIRIDKMRSGYECPLCSQENKNNDSFLSFIEKAHEVHGNKYDYSKVNYKTINDKVCIICPEHGEFWQTPNNHINQKQGCQKCYNEKRKGKYKITTNEFIEKAKEIHGNKYDYSKTVYRGMKKKLLIICPEHGEFEQVAYDHLRGFKCSKCKHNENRLSFEEFIEKAKKIHGDKYDYSKVNYKNNHTKICIICSKHGEFWQNPSAHLLGCGCQKCHFSRMERTLKKMLNDCGINFIEQYKIKWLGKQSLDFYLPDYNVAIECQGVQHVKNVKNFGDSVHDYLERDVKKNERCKTNDINIIYICENRYKNDFLAFKTIYNENNLLTIKNVYRYDNDLKDKLIETIKG